MPQIINITSEALQATIRRLLPSQQGFGEDLQASNVITPVIDLTPTAEGSGLPDYLQSAASFGNVTAFSVINTTSTLINTAGFYRVLGSVVFQDSTPGQNFSGFRLSDGLANKTVWGISLQQSSNTEHECLSYDFNVFLDSGENLNCISNDGTIAFIGSTYQLADINGVLTNPSGFTPQ